MRPIISAVPNICEGRDAVFIQDLREQLEAVPGLVVLDVSMDQIRNRTIFSFTGSKQAIFEGGLKLYERTLAKVDMRLHTGDYPRIGAVDAFPFVALKDVSLQEVVAWSLEFAQLVADRFQVPVYMAYESAQTPQRRDIEAIREGQYEGFAQKMLDPAWLPDFGPASFPPDRGATIIGARLPIVNLKAYLTTANEEAARWVARLITSPTQGMPGVKAYPGVDRVRGMALLSITVGNYRATPLYRVLEAIRMELRRFGAGISHVEMVGLVPQGALLDSALHYLQILDFPEEEVVEIKLDRILKEHADSVG